MVSSSYCAVRVTVRRRWYDIVMLSSCALSEGVPGVRFFTSCVTYNARASRCKVAGVGTRRRPAASGASTTGSMALSSKQTAASVAPSRKAPSVAVCISGQFRSFADHCAGPQTVQRVILPLRADVYAFMNAPSEHVNQSYKIARRILQHTSLRALHIASVESRMKLNNASCSKADPTAGTGYAQSRGLQQCGLHILPQRQGQWTSYVWIIRVRPDALIGFTMPRALPRRLNFDAPRGLAIVGFVSECGCGKFPASGGIRTSSNRCTRETLCGCSHDSFAMVNGRAAQEAYFNGFADDYDTCARKQFICPGCQGKAAECKLGASLKHRGIAVYDIRFLFSSKHKFPLVGRVHEPQICSRYVNMSRAAAAVGPVGGLKFADGALMLNANALHVLPPGPMDARMEMACAQPLSRRPAGWELLCA